MDRHRKMGGGARPDSRLSARAGRGGAGASCLSPVINLFEAINSTLGKEEIKRDKTQGDEKVRVRQHVFQREVCGSPKGERARLT